MDRRSFFQSLVAGGASVTNNLSGLPLKHRRRDKLPNDVIYHGPVLIPSHVAEIVRESPELYKSRSRQLVSRYAQDGWTWLFRCQIPESRQMVGEIVRDGSSGQLRVHCWSAARADGRPIRTPQEIIERKATADAPAASSASWGTPLMPPLLPGPSADTETSLPEWSADMNLVEAE